MTGIEINDRTEMFDVRGQVPAAYPPGHVYIIGEHQPEHSVLQHVADRAAGMGVRYFCIAGRWADVWEEKIREVLAREHEDGSEWEHGLDGADEIVEAAPMKVRDLLWTAEPDPLWKNKLPPGAGPKTRIAVCSEAGELAEDLTTQFLGRVQPRCYGYYDDRELVLEVRRAAEACLEDYRGRIRQTLEQLGTFEFGYFRKDYVVSIGDEDVMLGQLGREVICDTIEEALDLPVFNEWSLTHLWCRLQGQVGRRLNTD